MSSQDIDITQEEFDMLSSSRTVLTTVFRFEEMYGIIVSNYIEFEKDLINLSFEKLVREKDIYADGFEIRSTLNRRVINLMSSVKLYQDSLSHLIPKVFNNLLSKELNIKVLLSREYDSNKYYRFMETLRNYSQHNGLPVQLVTINLKKTNDKPIDLFEYSIDISSIKEKLLTDEKIKKSVIKEFDEKIDLKTAVRNYIQCLSQVHCEIRELISKSVDENRINIKNVQDRHKLEFGGNSDYIEVIKIEVQEVIEKNPLLLDWDTIRLDLTQQNKKLTNLTKKYVTSSLKN